MKLYITTNSPYARIARVAAIESGLASRIEVINVKTRDAKTDYFDISPLARVPALLDNGVLIADTRDICAHYDSLLETPCWCLPETDQSRTLRHIVCGFLDGVAVWLRETARASDQQSAPVIAYEEHRAAKALNWLENNSIFQAPIDFTRLTLGCALDIAALREMPNINVETAPRLLQWHTDFARRPSMQQTRPD